MNAFDSIVTRKPRENAGSMAANRFEYQLDWGLNKLLLLEESGQPYTVIFDYQDDILVLDSDESPNYIDFYQVKTNTSASGWQKNQLIQISKKKNKSKSDDLTLFDEEDDVEADEKYSKIAKLLIHSLDFPKEAREFFFVTNANLGSSLIKGGKLIRATDLSFADLVEKAKDEIKKRIKEELPNIEDDVFEHLHFIKNQMGVNDHGRTIIGCLNEFLEKHYPKAKVGVRPVYETLIGEIRKRNNYETIPKTVEELIGKKAFTKKQFHQFLKGLETLESIEAKETKIQGYLMRYLPNTASAKRRSITRQLQKIKEETLVYDNHEFLRLYNKIEVLLKETEGDQNEWEWSQKVLARLHEEFSFIRYYDDDFLTCLILYEI